MKNHRTTIIGAPTTYFKKLKIFSIYYILKVSIKIKIKCLSVIIPHSPLRIPHLNPQSEIRIPQFNYSSFRLR